MFEFIDSLSKTDQFLLAATIAAVLRALVSYGEGDKEVAIVMMVFVLILAALQIFW